MAAELGFEPRHTESESAVLPLHNSAIRPRRCKDSHIITSLSPFVKGFLKKSRFSFSPCLKRAWRVFCPDPFRGYADAVRKISEDMPKSAIRDCLDRAAARGEEYIRLHLQQMPKRASGGQISSLAFNAFFARLRFTALFIS